MTRSGKWLLGLGVVLAALGLLVFSVARMVPSDEELALRASKTLEQALGAPVTVGALHWRLLPWPVLVIEDVISAQPQPIKLQKLTLYPNVLALWQRRLKIDHAELQGAVVPQLSLRKLGAKTELQENPTEAPTQPGALSPDALPLARFVFHDVSWISRYGVAVVYDGEIDFDAGWRPRQAQLRRPGVQPVAELLLTRKPEGDDKVDRWDLRIQAGGGTAHGEVQLQMRDKGPLRLSGTLRPQGIEVASATSAFNRRPVISGRASGSTVLQASGDNVGELARSLHTRTTFTIGQARLLRFDLDKAIRSGGKEHAGQTPLDSVSGQLDTQNTAQGMVVNLIDIKASSGALTASGKARLANRQVEAELAVDLVDGLIGVPLRVSGPVANVKVSVPGGALLGAAVGTAVLPGIGTALGARIGATLGKIFGSGPDPAAPKKPAAPAK